MVSACGVCNACVGVGDNKALNHGKGEWEMILSDEEIKQLDCVQLHTAKWDEVEVYEPSVIDFARAVIAAYEKKLREEKEPKGYLVYFSAKLGGANVTDRLFVWRKELATNQVNADLIQKVVPVFEHPAPSAPKQEPFAWHSPTEGLSYENHYSDNQPLFEHPAPIPAEQIAEIKRKERERCAVVCATSEVPIDIAVWVGTKKEISAATAIALAEAIRSLGDEE